MCSPDRAGAAESGARKSTALATAAADTGKHTPMCALRRGRIGNAQGRGLPPLGSRSRHEPAEEREHCAVSMWCERPGVWKWRHACKARVGSAGVDAHLIEDQPAQVAELVQVGGLIHTSCKPVGHHGRRGASSRRNSTRGGGSRSSVMYVDDILRGTAPFHQGVNVVGMVRPGRQPGQDRAALHGAVCTSWPMVRKVQTFRISRAICGYL